MRFIASPCSPTSTFDNIIGCDENNPQTNQCGVVWQQQIAGNWRLVCVDVVAFKHLEENEISAYFDQTIGQCVLRQHQKCSIQEISDSLAFLKY